MLTADPHQRGDPWDRPGIDRRRLPPIRPIDPGWRWRGACHALVILGAIPVIVVALAHRLWRRRKGLVGWREKLWGHPPQGPHGAILVHGVSLGEVMLMRPLVPALERTLGGPCLLTTTTETGREALDRHFPEHVRGFLPMDLPWAVNRFLSRTRPRLVVLLELELWPVLLCACHARGIPVMVLNARVSDRSFRGYHRIRAVIRPLLRPLALVVGQNGCWTARLEALGVRHDRAVMGGSMKADMVRRAEPGTAAAEALRLGLDMHRPLLLAASTGPGEERLILEASAGLRAEGWQVVLCPRHPERGAAVAAICRESGLDPARSSLGESCQQPDQITIVDEIGRLGALYALTAACSGIAIVGGSLGSGRGGQNMLEAAAASCCTVVGPDTRNFPDAMALLRADGAVIEVPPEGLASMLRDLGQDADRRRNLGSIAEAAWRRGQGATGRALVAVAAAIDRTLLGHPSVHHGKGSEIL